MPRTRSFAATDQSEFNQGKTFRLIEVEKAVFRRHRLLNVKSSRAARMTVQNVQRNIEELLRPE